MSFKCLISYFLGIAAFALSCRVYVFYGNSIYTGLVLAAGFVVAQIICHVIHVVLKERAETLKDEEDWLK